MAGAAPHRCSRPVVTLVARSVFLLVLLAGCDSGEREQASGESGRQATGQTTQHTPTPLRPAAPVAADDQDDPDAPRVLPKSTSVGDWIKVRPVRVTAGNQLWKAIGDDERAARLSPFRVERLARCAYQRRDDAQGRLAEVELFEAVSPEDAIGMLLVECPGPDQALGHAPIGTIRTRQEGSRRYWHAWQGYHYVRVTTGAADDGDLKAVERLLGRILLSASGTAVPRLLDLLPLNGREVGQIWLVRSVRSLTGPAGPQLSWSDPDETDARLGLDGASLLALAAYQTPGTQEPNYVFIIRYATAEAARAAHRRWSARPPGTAPPCLLTDPAGPWLAGSWTPDRESLAHTLSEVKRILMVGAETAAIN